MNPAFYLLLNLLLLSGCGQVSSDHSMGLAPDVQTARDTCNSADANIDCFFRDAPKVLTNKMVITDRPADGEKLMLRGTLYKADGKTPYPDVLLYAYHTDATGYYSKSGNEVGVQKWHGRMHGWCKTDKKGQYEIHTIRPARYPDNSMPAHIHPTIKEPQAAEAYYISDFVFEDDSLVNAQYLKSIVGLTGGTGIVSLKRQPDGTWVGNRDIVLNRLAE